MDSVFRAETKSGQRLSQIAIKLEHRTGHMDRFTGTRPQSANCPRTAPPTFSTTIWCMTNGFRRPTGSGLRLTSRSYGPGTIPI